ncbi:PTS sugar transporter subunit IIA [Sporolactobacillus vineae]|uniref:PTS sugar transporter subunit IIA n=1 Tax=Sporolactobacillus vineae TaxID=444463 RepID=UPI000289C704|nr:fructose PTS transporter subunit IIA [Sporolactobacillus vineae]
MNVISEKLINLDIVAHSKQEAVNKLGSLLRDSGRLNDFDAYINNVIEREKLATTGIGFGIAIPHGKTDAVNVVSVAIGRLVEPLEWNSLDGEKVQMIFLLAVPEKSKGDEHLRILSELSRKLIHKDFRERLFQAENSSEVISLIGETLNKTLEAVI